MSLCVYCLFSDNKDFKELNREEWFFRSAYLLCFVKLFMPMLFAFVMYCVFFDDVYLWDSFFVGGIYVMTYYVFRLKFK